MGWDDNNMSGTFETIKIDESAAKAYHGIDSNLEVNFFKFNADIIKLNAKK